MKVIIWADDPDLALPVRASLREGGHTVMIRDARAFGGFADVERCEGLAFVSASKRALIISEYRSPAAQERYGQVQVFDVETGKFGEPVGLPDIPAVAEPPKEPSEADLLNNRTDRLTDDDLRTYVKVKTGADPAADATREDLEALLRQAAPGAAAAPAAEPPPPAPETEPEPKPPETPQEQQPEPTAGRGRRTNKPQAETKAE